MKRGKELAVGGFRDYYPELYQKINRILRAFREIPQLFGYIEYECPTVEPLQLYQLKSGTELVEETFKVTDRKNRQLVLRPETTPSLARMLAAQQQYYPRPIRWFSVSRVFRDETQQRGRVKEFWQLNVDLLGTEDIGADAEIINVLAAIIQSLGFTAEDFVIRINDRRLIQSYIESLGLTNYLEIIRILDRRDKLLQEAIINQLTGEGTPAKKAEEIALTLRHFFVGKQQERPKLPRSKQIDEIIENLPQIQQDALIDAIENSGIPSEVAVQLADFSSIKGSPAEFLKLIEKVDLTKETRLALEPLTQLATQLDDLGLTTFCEYDASIARGLDYYTGIVFEAWDRGTGLPRAIAGGGRYDDLVGILEGQPLPGTGFGFGETVILEIAEEKGLLPPPEPAADLYIAPVSKKQLGDCRQIATQLRKAGIRTLFNGFTWSLKKYLDDASKRQIPYVAIIGPRELAKNAVNLRDMKTGKEEKIKIVKLADFIRNALSH
ncbi:MAG: histidine--tRNA ligase [Candidatus Hodarchaeota archaeon]